MNNVSKITSMGMCVGCGSCNVCEHISLKENELGFTAPVVDAGCINCGKCLSECIYDPDREELEEMGTYIS